MVYAPGLTDLADTALLVDEVGVPVNVLLVPGGPSVAQLEVVGVRRISIGSSLARIAYGALVLRPSIFKVLACWRSTRDT